MRACHNWWRRGVVVAIGDGGGRQLAASRSAATVQAADRVQKAVLLVSASRRVRHLRAKHYQMSQDRPKPPLPHPSFDKRHTMVKSRRLVFCQNQFSSWVERAYIPIFKKKTRKPQCLFDMIALSSTSEMLLGMCFSALVCNYRVRASAAFSCHQF